MAESVQARYASKEEIADELLDLAGKTVLDVGCGDGRFTRILAARAAQVTGIDINQDALDRAAAETGEDTANIAWRNARAEAMPFEDGSFDVVAFSNSLHHVAPDMMATAIAEAARVLRPNGMLYVMEPVADGSMFAVTRRIHDESLVRERAKAAVDRAASSGFSPVAGLTFYAKRSFDSFEEFAEEQSRRGEKRRKTIESNRAEIREAFIKAARKDGGKLWFNQISRADLLKKSS